MSDFFVFDAHAYDFNEMPVESEDMLDEYLRKKGGRNIVLGLIAPTKEELTIFVGPKWGAIQWAGADRLPPYLMAHNEKHAAHKSVSFISGHTPTPIPAKFCMPIGDVIAIVIHFFRTQQLSQDVKWEQI